MTTDFWKRGIEEIINEKSFIQKLKSKKKLKIKLGVDPTKPDIHLGHAVLLWRLKELQNLGHKIIFIIGDYTTKVGDPSGRNKSRPVLSDKEIKTNSKSYFDQVGKILDLKKTEIKYNSEWYSKMNFNDILQIASKFTVAQIIERDDFEKRLKSGSDLSLSEMLYPVMQAYDSVVLSADVETGGTDQKFNMLCGRSLQKKFDQTPQEVITMKILVGLDGEEKMSKSQDNYIGITETAFSQFGKIMSIPDKAIHQYFSLCTLLSDSEISKKMAKIKKGINPRDIKEELAMNIVELYHGKKEALLAAKEFTKIFTKKLLPSNINKIKLSGVYALPALILELGAATSSSEARRLISQGAVKIDKAKLTDPKSSISLRKDMVIQVGKQKYYQIS